MRKLKQLASILCVEDLDDLAVTDYTTNEHDVDAFYDENYVKGMDKSNLKFAFFSNKSDEWILGIPDNQEHDFQLRYDDGEDYPLAIFHINNTFVEVFSYMPDNEEEKKKINELTDVVNNLKTVLEYLTNHGIDYNSRLTL